MAEKVRQKVAEKFSQIRYARIPDSVLLDKKLSLGARVVYAYLARAVFQGCTVKLGQRRIAAQLGIDRNTVAAAIEQLREQNHLTVTGIGKTRRVYVLHSEVFGSKQAAGVQEVVSSPSKTPRLASVRIA